MVDDRIEGRSFGEAEVWGSRSCGTFVRRNSESEDYDDPGGHRFVVFGMYRRCTVLMITLDMLVEVRGSKDGHQMRGIARKYVDKIRWPDVRELIQNRG